MQLRRVDDVSSIFHEIFDLVKEDKSYLLFVEDDCVAGKSKISANVRLIRDDVDFMPEPLKERITEAFLLVLKIQRIKCRFEIDVTSGEEKVQIKSLTVI